MSLEPIEFPLYRLYFFVITCYYNYMDENNEFEIGDKVKCVNSINCGPRYGDIYTVLSISARFIGFSMPHSQYSESIRKGTEANWGYSRFIKIGEDKVVKLLFGKS